MTVHIAIQIVVTLLFTVVTVKAFRKFLRKVGKDSIHLTFVKNGLSAFIWFTGIVLSLSWLPHFSDTAGTLLAGSGIAALTIGLAAQGALGNAFNGLFISISRPFEVGDRVHLVTANITGFIEDITIRHTVIRTFTNSRIIVPNSVINMELIENSNFANPQASAFIDVIITYDSDVTKATDIMARVIGNHPNFVDTRTEEQLAENAPKVPVFVRAIGLYGVELRASMWTETVATNFASCSEVRKGLLAEFEKADIRPATSKFIVPHQL